MAPGVRLGRTSRKLLPGQVAQAPIDRIIERTERMLMKRTKEIARAAGEAVGLIPSVADASKSADEHRQALIAAQAALENAQDALQAAHDRAAEHGEVTRREAALAAAKVEVSRCE